MRERSLFRFGSGHCGKGLRHHRGRNFGSGFRGRSGCGDVVGKRGLKIAEGGCVEDFLGNGVRLPGWLRGRFRLGQRGVQGFFKARKRVIFDKGRGLDGGRYVIRRGCGNLGFDGLDRGNGFRFRQVALQDRDGVAVLFDVSPSARMVAAASVGPKNGSPTNSPSAGIATKDTGFSRCATAKPSASASVSRATTATLTVAPLPDQSNTRSATS
jgi:hypothetical protein